MKHLIKYIPVILLMTLAVASFQSCKKDQDPPKTIEITTYDALKYFQNSIIHVDSLGNFQYRALGMPLNADDTAHLFIGVDSLPQAEAFFRQWIAPDVEITEDHGNLTCPLTDKDGNAQGTVYFKPASGNGLIAEVSASDDTRLLYFRRITFMHNDNWPLVAPESKWHKFDIVHNLDIPIKDYLKDGDKSLNWVCVRESGNGVKPIFCAVTNSTYEAYDVLNDGEYYSHYMIRNTWFCPAVNGAHDVSNMLRTDWDLFYAVFKEASGTGDTKLDWANWINESHTEWFMPYYSVVLYKSNYIYGISAVDDDDKAPFLLRIEWVDDEDIYDGATIPNHQ